MHKLFHIELGDCLLWQISYADHEIDKFIRLRHDGPPEKKEKKKSQYLKRKTQKKDDPQNSEKIKRIELGNEGNCPICQMEITEGDDLT